MGRSPRPRPRKLARKLLTIRRQLGLSQTEMCKALGLTVHYSAVSQYELGTREPPIIVLLHYARMANVPLEVLADDALDLPDVLPTRSKRVDHVKRV
jgi:transcriptional regulator with XRE-family HTH domain